jgi:Tfp pilus assembly protein PilF
MYKRGRANPKLLRLAGLLLMLATAPPVFGEQPAELAEGTRALYRGDYAAAARRAERFLKGHPGGAPAARLLLARARIAQGDYFPAYEELLKALRTDPQNIDALYYLARVCALLSQMEYHRLFALAPDSMRVHQLLAQSYEMQENAAKAEEEYQAALKANPQSVEILDAIGELKRHQYKFDEAISYYSRAGEIQPRDYDSAYGLGACYLFQHNPARAIEHFRRALATDPDSAAARFALGDALLRANQPSAAITELKAATALEPKMRQAYTLLARAYTRLGQSREAEEALKKEQALGREGTEWREELLRMERTTLAPSNPPPAEDTAPKREH